MEREKTVLIVDDDANILHVTGFAIRKAGYRVVSARDGREALELFTRERPDLVILDIMMPEMDGTDVCRRIQAEAPTPVIFLSSRDDEIDRIVGLELGADDYVTKPFSPRELVARIKAVLRRVEQKSPEGYPHRARFLEYGELRLDPDRFCALWKETEVSLTATEFALLKTLLAFPGKVYSRDELMSRAYELSTVVSDRTIDSHIRHIREKFRPLGGDFIETVHGIGYKLSSCRSPL